MSTIFTFLIILSIFIIILLTNNRKISPILIFIGVWTIIMFFYSLKLYGINDVRIDTLFIILIGLIMFSLGYLTITLKKFEEKKKSDYKTNYILLIIFALVASYLYLKDLSLIIELKLNLYEVRQMISTVNSPIYQNRTTLDGVLHILVANPFAYAMTIIGAIEFIKNKDYKPMLINIVIVTLHVLTHGDRLIVVMAIFNFIIVYFFINHKRTFYIFKRKKLMLSVMISFAVFFFVYIAILRGSDPIKSLYFYLTGVVPHLDVRLLQINTHGEYTLGFSSFNGFLSPLFQILNNLGLNRPDILFRAQELSFVENPVYITATEQMNAFVSPFFYFYLDFRIIGVIVLSFVYGLFTSYLFTRFIKDNSTRKLFLVALVTQGLLFSMIRFEFANPTYSLAFLYVIIYSKRRIKL